MNTYTFRVKRENGEIRYVDGYGNTRNEAYNNVLEKISPEEEILNW